MERVWETLPEHNSIGQGREAESCNIQGTGLRQTQLLGSKGPPHQTTWDSTLASISQATEGQAGTATDIGFYQRPTLGGPGPAHHIASFRQCQSIIQ